MNAEVNTCLGAWRKKGKRQAAAAVSFPTALHYGSILSFAGMEMYS